MLWQLFPAGSGSQSSSKIMSPAVTDSITSKLPAVIILQFCAAWLARGDGCTDMHVCSGYKFLPRRLLENLICSIAEFFKEKKLCERND